MRIRVAALAASLACVAAVPSAVAGERLTLDDAFARVLESHPDLRAVETQRSRLSAERDVALQGPPLRVGVELENALGTGAAEGFDGAELTLGLASVLETGDKAALRGELAQSRIDALAGEREVRRLDLLAETARRHAGVQDSIARGRIAAADVAQRRRAEALASARHREGASPLSVVLSARAALAGAELEQAAAHEGRDAARRHLARMWGEADPDFELVADDTTRLPALLPLDALERALDASPGLARFADERRIAEARLRLEQARARADIDWQVGMRRLQDSGDTGFVAGFSVPLGNRGRAAPAIRAAEAELAGLDLARESRERALLSTVVDAHGRYTLARLRVQRHADEILPALERATDETERAWRLGAATPLEWTQMQQALSEARRRQLDAALEARLALIELQRLTGLALVVPAQGDAP